MADSSAPSGKIKFKTAAGEWQVEIAGFKNVIAFERHFNVGAVVLERAPRLEYVAYMAWTAARDAGLPVADKFDRFIDDVIELEVVDEDGPDQNPSDEGQSAAL